MTRAGPAVIVPESARNLLAGLGLLRLARALREVWFRLDPRVLVRNARFRRGAPDGLPLPSTRLRLLVAGTADIAWFLEGGARAARGIRDCLARNGAPLEGLASLLDFGCGCGRVLRHWRELDGVRIHGADLNPLLVEEARRTLPFAEVVRNGPEPPLPYAGRTFDLLYSLSVFTHLDEEQHLAWRDEVRRVLKPGGLWLVTTHGESYLARLPAAAREEFRAGRLVCQRRRYKGQNLCVTYHPERYVRRTLAQGFEVLEFVPRGAQGNPHQDQYLLRRVG